MKPNKRRDRRRASRPSHMDARGRVVMVDVGSKPPSLREAVAEGTIRMSPLAHRMMRGGRVAKGDAIALARVAGIAAAKRTSELIPLCHAIPLDHVEVEVRYGADGRTMKVEAYMHPVFVRHRHELIYFFNSAFINLIRFLWRDIPGSIDIQVPWISHWDSYKIESPVAHPLKLFFGSSPR